MMTTMHTLVDLAVVSEVIQGPLARAETIFRATTNVGTPISDEQIASVLALIAELKDLLKGITWTLGTHETRLLERIRNTIIRLEDLCKDRNTCSSFSCISVDFISISDENTTHNVGNVFCSARPGRNTACLANCRREKDIRFMHIRNNDIFSTRSLYLLSVHAVYGRFL